MASIDQGFEADRHHTSRHLVSWLAASFSSPPAPSLSEAHSEPEFGRVGSLMSRNMSGQWLVPDMQVELPNRGAFRGGTPPRKPDRLRRTHASAGANASPKLTSQSEHSWADTARTRAPASSHRKPTCLAERIVPDPSRYLRCK